MLWARVAAARCRACSDPTARREGAECRGCEPLARFDIQIVKHVRVIDMLLMQQSVCRP